MRPVLLLLLSVLAPVQADFAHQTDWSGGYGVTGPVLDLGIDFRLDTEVAWGLVPGELSLLNVAEHSVTDDFYNARRIHSADIDGDGDRDILGVAEYDYKISWLENVDGSGEAWLEHVIFLDQYWFTSSVHGADVDSDGDVDVLGSASSYPDNLAAWWENDGTGAFSVEHPFDTTSAGVRSLSAVDMDGDLDIDITGTAEYNSLVLWWENIDGAGESWTRHIVGSEFTGPRSACPADIDCDGDFDMVAASNSGDQFAWWENLDGTGGEWSETRVISYGLESPASVFTSDIDGDGDTDVLGAASEVGCFLWWENLDGLGGSWTEHQITDDCYGACSVHSDDMDLDGDPDVIGAALFQDNVSWWENSDGTGSGWIRHQVDTRFDYASDVHTDDINEDGYPDIIGAARFDDMISWWDIRSYSSVGLLESSILDTECSPGWTSLDWNCLEPSGTAIFFQYRSSDDHTLMGNWSEPVLYPGVIHDLSGRYVQYLVTLETSSPDTTPVLFDLTLSWDPLSVSKPTEPIPMLTGVRIVPNPASTPSIGFHLSEAGVVSLSVFSIAGHLVVHMPDVGYTAGNQSVVLDMLTPGVYFCRMTRGSFSFHQRFVVVE